MTDQLGDLSHTNAWRTSVERVGHGIDDRGLPGAGRAGDGKEIELGEIHEGAFTEAREPFDLETNWTHRLAPRRAR